MPTTIRDSRANQLADDLKNQRKQKSLARKVNFIVDSAATICVVCDIKYLQNIKKIDSSVLWGQASKLQVKIIGDLYIKFTSSFNYRIKDIYFIPDLGINLLSVSRLDNLITLFTKENAILYSKQNKRAVATAKNVKHLYITQVSILERRDISLYRKWRYKSHQAIHQTKRASQPNIESNQESNQESEYIPKKEFSNKNIYIWHQRIGHINKDSLKKLLNNTISNDIRFDQCEICLKSKYNRHINKISNNLSSYTILDRIYSAIGGPLEKTYNNYRYYIIFLDKKSRYLWIRLLKTIDKAYISFELYRAMMENQYNSNIKEFFTDNGKEYINKRFAMALQKRGIKHFTTPIYTKEPNGLIERLNLTLLNKVRSLLYQSNNPSYL